VLAVGVFAAVASAQPRVGFADDAMKYSDDGGGPLFDQLKAVGAVENRVAVYWDPANPTTIQEQGFLDRFLPVAQAKGVQVVFSVYPRSALTWNTDTDNRIAQFANYLKILAHTYPQVREYVVLNEPNEAYFLSPQHAADGTILSAGIAERILAAGYDALKSVDQGITVAGLGVSPAANDQTSTSPVRFIDALGRIYKASGRKTPLMDVLDLHIYPDDAAHQDDQTHYAWPQIGPGDVSRIKQAIWDAFNGTGQPVFQEPGATGPFLRMRIGEIGWQVAIQPSLRGQYTSAENVKVTDEARQARIYANVAHTLGCDPTITSIDFFHLIDDRDLVHYQSGLLRVDGSPRPSYAAVKAAIAEPCGPQKPWRHTNGVLAATASFTLGNGSTAAMKLKLGAGEDVDAAVAILRVSGKISTGDADRMLAGQSPDTVVGSGHAFIKGGGHIPVTFSGGLGPGTYVVAVRMTATMNPNRWTTAVSAPFTVQ
jgi:hypothetical protein